ncbi:MAG: hypothetical protein AAF570_10080, partial [Bacteroidota bacterium]
MIVLSLLAVPTAYAQCETCGTIPDKVVAHCYTNPELPGKCVMFIEGSRTFYFEDQNRKKNKQLELPLPAGDPDPDIAYLTSLQSDKKRKLTAGDLIFI